MKMASAYASILSCPVAVLHTERLNGKKTVVSKVVGEVRAKPCVIIDDMISTGGTIRNAIETLIQAGATHRLLIAASHAVFTPEARKTMNDPSIRNIIVAESIPVASIVWPQVSVVFLRSI